MIDQTILLYSSEIIISICLFILYVGWWIREGKSSWIFKYLVLLYIGIIIDTSICLIGRSKVLQNDYSLLQSWVWPIKEYLFTICLLLILCHSLYRLLFVTPSKD
jgi:hypothetical protein